MTDKIIVAVIGLITGALGSVIAPWAKWSVEKRRMRMTTRRDKIAGWRLWLGRLRDRHGINESLRYTEIRPYLRESTRRMIEGGPVVATRGRGGDPVMNAVLEDLGRLEARWGLSGSAPAYWAGEIFRLAAIPARRLRALIAKRREPGGGKIVRQRTPRE